MSSNILSIATFVLQALSLLIVGRALLSWFDPGYRSAIGRVIHDVTEPIIGPLRRVLPQMGMFDLSPIAAIILLQVIERLLIRALG